MVQSVAIDVSSEALFEVSLSNDTSTSNVGEGVLLDGTASDV